jgi:hypothetical protein
VKNSERLGEGGTQAFTVRHDTTKLNNFQDNFKAKLYKPAIQNCTNEGQVLMVQLKIKRLGEGGTQAFDG